MTAWFNRLLASAVYSALLASTSPLWAQPLAYVTSSTDNLEIRVLEIDRGNDRSLLRLPADTPPEFGVGTLSWRPDGREIVFDSGYDSALSMAIRDLYAVSADGNRIRRLTNGPSPEALASRPKGTVTVGVRSPAFGAELLVYVEGGTEFVRFTAEPNVNYTVTLASVADLGPNVRQYVRVFNATPPIGSSNCHFDVALYADVVPGQSVDAGFISLVVNDYSCARAFSPSWLADGSGLVYLRRQVEAAGAPTNDIWRIDAQPVPLQMGESILDMSRYATTDKLFRVVAGPPARGNEMLFLRTGALVTPIFLGTLANLDAAAYIDLGLCPATTCKVLDLEWLPDGSGFYLARHEDGFSYPDAGGVIYRFDLASRRGREVIRTRGTAIGAISLSPDGERLAYERAARLDEAIDTVRFGPRLQCPCEIWSVDVDGTNAEPLISDGRAPAWQPNGLPALPDLIFGADFES